MTRRERWTVADRAAEVCAIERDIEATGLGPARTRDLVDGAVAVLDAAGRVHAVVGWAFDRAPCSVRAEAA